MRSTTSHTVLWWLVVVVAVVVPSSSLFAIFGGTTTTTVSGATASSATATRTTATTRSGVGGGSIRQRQSSRRTINTETNDDKDDDASSCDDGSGIKCHLVRTEILIESGTADISLETTRTNPTALRCITHDDDNKSSSSSLLQRQNFAIKNLSTEFLSAHEIAIESGKLHVCLPENTYDIIIDEQVLVVRDESRIVVLLDDQQYQGRDLQNNDDDDSVRYGMKRLLAVRVITDTEQPDESIDEIRDAIFGNKNNQNNQNDPITIASVVEQYDAISHGQLQYVPATSEHPDINDGVLELNLGDKYKFVDNDFPNFLMAIVLSRLRMELGAANNNDIADHYMFCLPNGSLFEENEIWTAFTYLYEPYSYYQKSRCARLSVAVHEIGHSLGFQHSGVGDDKYADKSCAMGYAVNKVGHPLKAFNGHKHWVSGWFDDHAVEVTPSLDEPVHRRLLSFVDYDAVNTNNNGIISNNRFANDDAILIKLDKLYIQYNRAKGYNVDADEPDTVTITYAESFYDVSYRWAALRPGERFSSDDNNISIVIEVCSTAEEQQQQLSTGGVTVVDYAVIAIYYESNNGQPSSSPCTKELPWPTDAPTHAPTLAPNDAPTPVPTTAPTAETRAPTVVETNAPTNVETNVPTGSPNMDLGSIAKYIVTAEPVASPSAAPVSAPVPSGGSPQDDGDGDESSRGAPPPSVPIVETTEDEDEDEAMDSNGRGSTDAMTAVKDGAVLAGLTIGAVCFLAVTAFLAVKFCRACRTKIPHQSLGQRRRTMPRLFSSPAKRDNRNEAVERSETGRMDDSDSMSDDDYLIEESSAASQGQ